MGGKKIVYMLKVVSFEMGPNKICIKWWTWSNFGGQKDRLDAENGKQNRGAYLLTVKEGVPLPPGLASQLSVVYSRLYLSFDASIQIGSISDSTWQITAWCNLWWHHQARSGEETTWCQTLFLISSQALCCCPFYVNWRVWPLPWWAECTRGLQCCRKVNNNCATN